MLLKTIYKENSEIYTIRAKKDRIILTFIYEIA